MKKKIILMLCLLAVIVLIYGSMAYSQMNYYSPYPIYYPIVDPYYFYYSFPITRNANLLGGGTTSLLLSTLTTPTATTIPTLFNPFVPTAVPTTPTLGTLTTLLALGGGGINTNTLLLLGLF